MADTITWFRLVSGGIHANPTATMFLSLAGSQACISKDVFMQFMQGVVKSGNWADYYNPLPGVGSGSWSDCLPLPDLNAEYVALLSRGDGCVSMGDYFYYLQNYMIFEYWDLDRDGCLTSSDASHFFGVDGDMFFVFSAGDDCMDEQDFNDMLESYPTSGSGGYMSTSGSFDGSSMPMSGSGSGSLAGSGLVDASASNQKVPSCSTPDLGT